MTKKKSIPTAILTLLAVGLLAVNIMLINSAEARLAQTCVYNYNQGAESPPVTVENIEKIQEKISSYGITFCSELEAVKNKGQEFIPVLTNQNYFKVNNLELAGDGITEKDVKSKNRVVVIGDDLALKLFFTTDSVGKKIYINGLEYTVSGVYKSDNSLIGRLSQDGRQRVYIPCTATESYVNHYVQTIYCEKGSHTAVMLEQMGLEQYYRTDFSEKKMVIKDFEHIIFLMLYVALCAVAFWLWYKVGRHIAIKIRESLEENYLKQSLKAIPYSYALLALVAVGIPALLAFIFAWWDFSIYIPGEYIPYDNIFDVEYYISTLTQKAQEINSLRLTGDTYLFNLYSRYLNILPHTTVIFGISLAVVTEKITALINSYLQRRLNIL